MTKQKKVYWASIEYTFSKEAQDYGKFSGGFVYAFVNALDVRDALEKVLLSLEQQALVPLDIEFIMPYDKNMEWEKETDTAHYLHMCARASKSEEVLFDVFYDYEKE